MPYSMFTIIVRVDGYHFKVYGPINYTSIAFNSKMACYTFACERGYVPVKGAFEGKEPIEEN
mgnify:CR=1 FL=1